MSTALVRTTVNFHGDPLEAIQQDGVTYAPVKPICDILGLDWEGQRQRIQNDEVLSSTACVIQVVAADGKQREMVCLPDEMLHGWLFGVEVKRVRPELRERLILYKRECYRVLHQAFTGQPTHNGVTLTHTEAAQIRTHLAELERLHRQRLSVAAKTIYDVQRFVAECCEECEDETRYVTQGRLYWTYVDWADERRYYPLTSRQFNRQIGSRWFRTIRYLSARPLRREVIWSGLTLKEQPAALLVTKEV